MRRNFAQVIKDAKIDVKVEYQKLYGMLFDRSIQVSNTKRISAYDEFSDYFLYFFFRGTCLSLAEFDDLHGYHFDKEPSNFNIYHLVTLCEYIYNMLIEYCRVVGSQYGGPPFNVQLYQAQIYQVVEAIGYMQANQDGFVIFTEKSPAAIAVAESDLIPENVSYKLISYNHHAMKGQLETKKATLLQLASILEGKRSELKQADETLERDLFYAFNNLNIRHNNTNPEDTKKFKEYVAKMSADNLEFWYDEIYQMSLLAFMQMEHIERKQAFDALKSAIER